MAIAAKPSFIPNLKKPVVATPVTAPVAVAEPQPVEENTMEETQVEAPVKKTRKKSEGERKTPNRQMNNEDIQFIVANVKTMSYTQIAEARGITNHQVNRVLMSVKKDMRAAAAGNDAKAALVEAYIKENLSRPDDTQPGAGRSSAVKDSIDDIVGNILNSIK